MISYSLSNSFFLFLFLLSFGTFIFLPLVNSQLTGSAHSSLVSYVGASCSALSYIGLGLNSSYFFKSNLLVLIHMITLFIVGRIHKDKRSLFVYFLYIASNVIAVSFLFLFLFYKSIQQTAFLILCALILGVINYTMILGHYYLVVPKLTVKPLIIAMRVYWVLIILKLALVYPYVDILKLWNECAEIFFTDANYGPDPFDVSLISLFIFQQLSCYLALPVLSLFSYKLCKIRSTQSATGLFYVMVFFALISEMISVYFFMTKGLYF